MRHRLFLLILMIFVATFSNAQVITRQQAQKKALAFMRQKGMPVEKGITYAPITQTTTNEEPIFVFNASDDKGFVIVSGDEQTDEILGYGTDNRFDEKKLPETMRQWLKGYTTQIEKLQQGRMKASPLRIPTHDAVGKLITASWDQGEASSTGDAYNQLCPKIDGIHCVTGCAATAMAQVMYFHKWPQSYTAKIPAYTSETIGSLSGLPSIKFDWGYMLDRYDEGQTTKQCKAVAQLMQYCGYALKMDYSTDASSAYPADVAMALRTYFDYDINTRYVKRTDYSTVAWDKLIYKEISNGRPVFYHGENPGGGHAFVCDGYDGQGFYHINWGWGGYGNGFFKLSILNPKGGGTGSSSSNNGYSSQQGAIVGIQRPTDDDDDRRTLSLEDFTRDGHSLQAQYCNRTGIAGTFDYGFCYQLADANSNTYQLEKLSDYYDLYDARTISTNLDLMELEDGVYNFYPYTILTGSSWYHMVGDYTKYYQVTVSNGQVTNIAYHPRGQLYIDGMECVGNRIVNQPQEIAITIRNEGEEFNDKFYLFASQTNEKGEAIDEITLPVESGGVEQTSLYFKPQSTGTWNVWIDIDEDGANDLNPITINIREAPTSTSNLSVESVDLIPKTDVIFKARIKNNGWSGYYMPIICYLFENNKQYNISFDKSQYMNIGRGETSEVTFRFESLQLGHTYSIHMQYYTDHSSGNRDWLGNSYKFTVNEEASPTDAINNIVGPSQTNDVYSMSGVLLRKGTTTTEDLPKGIYIIGGKKRVIK